jgi:hypothetical protein
MTSWQTESGILFKKLGITRPNFSIVSGIWPIYWSGSNKTNDLHSLVACRPLLPMMVWPWWSEHLRHRLHCDVCNYTTHSIMLLEYDANNGASSTGRKLNRHSASLADAAFTKTKSKHDCSSCLLVFLALVRVHSPWLLVAVWCMLLVKHCQHCHPSRAGVAASAIELFRTIVTLCCRLVGCRWCCAPVFRNAKIMIEKSHSA